MNHNLTLKKSDISTLNMIRYDEKNLIDAMLSASITSSARFNSYTATPSSEISNKLGDIPHHLIIEKYFN